jgi:hypothetical protein
MCTRYFLESTKALLVLKFPLSVILIAFAFSMAITMSSYHHKAKEEQLWVPSRGAILFPMNRIFSLF